MLIGAYEDNVLFLASALTFDALLAALPFVVLLLSVLGAVVRSSGDALTDILQLFHALIPTAAGAEEPFRRSEDLLRGVVESRAEVSLVAIPFFVWFSTRMFSSARNALNDAFDTDEGRPYVVGKALDFCLVLLTLLLVVASIAFTVRTAPLPLLGRVLGDVSTFALGVVLFFVVYIVLPSRRIRWDTALVASAVASVGFEIARRLYGWYLSEFATVDRLISNANAIAVVLLVVWMYFTALVFLLGAEVAETYDLARRQREQRAVLA